MTHEVGGARPLSQTHTPGPARFLPRSEFPQILGQTEVPRVPLSWAAAVVHERRPPPSPLQGRSAPEHPPGETHAAPSQRQMERCPLDKPLSSDGASGARRLERVGREKGVCVAL